MNFLSPFFLTLGLSGLCIVIAGWCQLRFPPKQINSTYGYRSAKSMANDQAWHFAQGYSARQMLRYGLVMCVISPVGWFLGWNPIVEIVLGLVALVPPIVMLVISTERALQQQYDQTEPIHESGVE